MEGISKLGDVILAVKIGTQPGGEDESKDGCQIVFTIYQGWSDLMTCRRDNSGNHLEFPITIAII